MPRFAWTVLLLTGIGIALLFSAYTEDPTTILATTWKQALRRAQSLLNKKTDGKVVLSADFGTAQQTAYNMTRTPVYFISHGGPNVMEETTHPAYPKFKEIGREITQKVKPKAVVVFSAHWEGGQNEIEVNTATHQGLIYDFYGFPPHYYEMKYPNEGSPEIAEKVISLLGKAGIKSEGVRRGLDHGVWATFKIMFDPEENPLNCPVVQVSIYQSDDPDKHYALGKAVQSLRDEGVQLFMTGQAVHNLRDMWKASMQPGPMPYTVSFDEALKEAVEQPPASRQQAMADLLKRPDAKRAHPTFDHLLPIHVAAGAAGEDLGKQRFTMHEGSMSWAQYRFGEVSV